MAATIQKPAGARGRFRRVRYNPMSEINVTPFVDVMLVLLVIFMVAAPLLNVGVPLDLPKTDAKPISGQDEPITVSVKADGEVYLQETKITIEELNVKLKAITQSKPDQRIFVRGDKGVAYGRVLEVMGAISGAGFTKVGLVAEQPGPAAPAAKGAAPAPAPAPGKSDNKK
jgi:biopolymer transport protein TolR